MGKPLTCPTSISRGRLPFEESSRIFPDKTRSETTLHRLALIQLCVLKILRYYWMNILYVGSNKEQMASAYLTA